MKWFSRLFQKRAVSGLARPERWLLDALGARPTNSGVQVNEETALRSSAVFAAVRVLSESVASLPLIVYRRLGRGKERASDHPLYTILHDRANEEMTAFTFREVMMQHLLLWGNAYAEIEYDNAGRVRGLWPLRPDKTWPEREERTKKLVYRVILPDGQGVTLPAERVLHIPAFAADGIVGRSPIRLAREAIGLALAAEEFGARFFGQGATLGGVLEHPGQLSEEALKRLRESFENMHQGLSRAHRIAILEEGMSYKQIGIPPEDAQFLETRKFQVTEIARIFRVPPHMIGDLERATFSNIEHQSIEFVVHSLRPWLVRWEQAINWKLFTPSERQQFFAEFLVDGLLRGDIRSRYEAYAIGRQWGWLSANDVRELENLNPVEGGDVYLSPMNMVPATQIGQSKEANEEQDEGTASDDEERRLRLEQEERALRSANARRRLAKSYRRIFAAAANKVVKQEAAALREMARKAFAARDMGLFLDLVERYYRDEFRELVENNMLPVLLAYAEAVQAEAANEVQAPVGLSPELVEFVRAYFDGYVQRHAASSKAQMRDVVTEATQNGEEPLEAVEQRLSEWEEKRADKIAQRETVQAGNAVSVATYLSAGVLFKRWVAIGDTCPYCRRLDGKIVGIGGFYLQAGEEYHPEGAEAPLVPSVNVGHPPLHRGCDCMVVAAF